MIRWKTILYWLGTFLLPIAILIVAAWANRIYPFGDQTFIIADLRTQYIDFFAWYQNVLEGNTDPFYTTTQGLGSSTAGMVGYYLASPFNVLILLFEQHNLPLFCFVISLLKAGCVQLSMQFFLRKRFELSALWGSTLALGFTLSLWTITQIRNPMWMDGLILLPLCAWGICCLLRKGAWRLLALSYGACVLTNWYMGYMIGLFLCLYAFFEDYALSTEGALRSGSTPRKRLLIFGGSMVLGLALSSMVFVPSILSLLDSGTTGGAHGKFSTTHQIIAERLPALANVPMTVILLGIAVVILGIITLAFVLLRKHSLRIRIAVVVFAALMLCLLGCLLMPGFQQGSVLDVLQALAFGKWEYERTPQIFASFLILLLALWLFCTKRIALKLKLAIGLFLLLLLLSAWLAPLRYIWGGFRMPAGYHSRMSFLFVFMLTWCAGLALHTILADSSASSKLARYASMTSIGVVALLLTVCGVLIRCTLTWHSFYADDFSQTEFDAYMADGMTQVAELEERDPGVYRVEKTYWRLGEMALNEGMTLGVNQLESYSSTGDQNLLQFLTALGMGNNRYHTYAVYPSLLGDSLFGIKYKSSEAQPDGYVDAGFMTVSEPEGARFYENPYALSLAYAVPESITGFELPEGNKWVCLNAFASALVGREVAPYPDTTLVGGWEPVEQPLDMAAFQSVIGQLKECEFTFDEFGGSHISGTMNATDGQMLLMTIPNQDGWSVTVNGQAMEPQDVANGALMAIPVQPGENYVEMQFTTPGLYVGAALTVLALLFVLCAPFIRRRTGPEAAQEGICAATKAS